MMMSLEVSKSENTLNSEPNFKEIVATKYNNIRFPQYRLACKLRYLQKISNIHLVDLYNTLESFREFGLNGNPDLNALVSHAQVHSLMRWLFHQLSQRLPPDHQLDVYKSSQLVYSWLVQTYDINQSGFINVFALKIALSLICSAKYSNKLRYLFSLISNQDGYLVQQHFDLYLRYVQAIANYFENISTLFFNEDLHSAIFDFSTPIDEAHFVQVLTCFENKIEYTSWLIIFHLLADAESVTHSSITCNACKKNEFQGFRYKCKKCNNYNLCQECFWTGQSSDDHDPDSHPCKELLFSSPKGSNFGRSIRKSFRNSFRRIAPSKKAAPPPAHLSQPVETTPTLPSSRKRIDLSNIISSQTLSKRFTDTYEYCFLNPVLDSADDLLSLGTEEEHTLIGFYLDLLANSNNNHSQDSMISSTNSELSLLNSFEKTAEQLEEKNRRLMQRIALLKATRRGERHHQQVSHRNAGTQAETKSLSLSAASIESNDFINELVSLRRKKDDLEQYLDTLQDRRRLLMVKLDQLMKQVKGQSDAENDQKDQPRHHHHNQLNGNQQSSAMENLVYKLACSQIDNEQLPAKSGHYGQVDEYTEADLKSKALLTSVAFS